MNARTLACGLALTAMTLVAAPRNLRAQGPETPPVQAAPSEPPGAQGTDRPQHERRPGVIGKIFAIQADSLSVTQQDGTQIQLKLTSETEFRKERQPAKSSDFKVGDTVMVRTDSNAQPVTGATAVMVAAMPAEFLGRGGMGGDGRLRGAGGQGMMQGILGKDYVVGEVKSIDAPKLTVLRTDNVTQTIELNEDTSLKRGRDSITMADIQAGDHIFARGTAPKDLFVPTNVNVIPSEMWARMQERATEGGAARGNAGTTSQTPASGQKPPERPN